MADEASAVEGFDGQGAAPAPKSSVLRLRGLPFSAGDEDVRQFFSDFNVAQVVVCRRGGRSTGEGYVQLDSIAAAADAITKLHRQTMGHRYVEIFESTEADIATAKSLSVDRMRGFVVRCRGLPYTATAQDVLNFFGSDVPVVRGIEGVVFTYAPDGRPTGEAFVELQTEDAQREALKKHKETIGSRYIELFVSTKADMIQAIQQNRMVLGFSNRKRWLQQQGVNVMHGPHGGGHMGFPGHHGAGPHYGGLPHHGGPRRHHHQYGQVEEVTDMMAGFNMGGHGHMQVIGPNGAVLPPGTYHLEVPRDHLHKGGPGQQRFAYPPGGRGGRSGRGLGPFPGRGGVPVGGRGMGQARYPNRPPPPGVMGVAPIPPAPARQTAQVVPINNGNNGGNSAGGAQQGQGNTPGQGATQGQQQQSQQQQQKAAQQQAQQQQVQAVVVQEVGVPQGGQQQQQQQQQYIVHQQPMPQQQYEQQQQWGGAQQQAALYAAGQQPGGIQGAYTLAALVPGSGAVGGYGDYQAGVVPHGHVGHVGHQGVVHGGVLQGVALDGSGVQGAGLQTTWGPR